MRACLLCFSPFIRVPSAADAQNIAKLRSQLFGRVRRNEGRVRRTDSIPEADALIEFPDELFADEAEVFHSLGMGVRASLESEGFDGFFRQHWSDFCVTEIPSFSGGPLSRTPDYTIPKNLVFDAAQHSQITTSKELFSVPELTTTNQGGEQNAAEEKKGNDAWYVECCLHKQHVAHAEAISLISQILRVHPHAISFAGMKDYVGDTIQKIRIRGTSPHALLEANVQLRKTLQKSDKTMKLFNFSYSKEPLLPGDLAGNHFRILLRGVTASNDCVSRAMDAFQERGFPNYFGCQRFSWFAGRDDVAFSLFHKDFYMFAHRLLDYTQGSLSLRQLLERKKKYPLSFQDAYRRALIRRLKEVRIEPCDVDALGYTSAPEVGDVYEKRCQGNIRRQFVENALFEAFNDVEGPQRRMLFQRLSSYLWNQALSIRIHNFGYRVLVGDFVLPHEFRQVAEEHDDRSVWSSLVVPVKEDNIDQFTIFDVVHPGFAFDNGILPNNAVQDIYLQICEKYSLTWTSSFLRKGIKDFIEPPRPIFRQPQNLRWELNSCEKKLTLEFELERGCYANVALTELMKTKRCVGQEKVTFLPLPSSAWDSLGERDPSYVESFIDIYPEFENGRGEARNESIEEPTREDLDIFAIEGPLFNPPELDPYNIAKKWHTRNVMTAGKRQVMEKKEAMNKLFEPALAKLLVEKADEYGGHGVPYRPNAPRSNLRKQLENRRRAYPGAPRHRPRVQMGSTVKLRRKATEKEMASGTWHRVL